MKSKTAATILKLSTLLSLAFLHVGIGAYSQEKNQEVIIKGTIRGDNKGFDEVICMGEGVLAPIQTMKNGIFEFKIQFTKPIYVQMFTEYDQKITKKYKPSGLLIDQPGVVEILIENIDNGFESAAIAGLQSAVLYQSVSKGKREINDRIVELTKMKHGKSSVPGDDPEFEEIESTRDSLKNVLLDPFLLEFIARNKKSYVGVFVLYENQEFIALEKVIKTYDSFSTELRNSIPGKKISAYIEGALNSQIGSIAKTFTLQTHEGIPFNFEQLKGNYVVLDFWASWCRPCRESFPRMREVNAKYQDKGVRFLNISIDENKQDWLEAVKKESNPWPQLLDDKGISRKFFGVYTIPTTYLIDAEGKIIAKEIGFKSNGPGIIERKLKQVYEHEAK